MRSTWFISIDVDLDHLENDIICLDGWCFVFFLRMHHYGHVRFTSNCYFFSKESFSFYEILSIATLILHWRFKKKVYYLERGHEQGKGGEKEPQADSTPPAQSSNPQTMRSWPELKPRVGCSTDWATQILLHWKFLRNVVTHNFRDVWNYLGGLLFVISQRWCSDSR